MTRAALLCTIACLPMPLVGCVHQNAVRAVVTPAVVAAPWQGPVRLATAGSADLDAQTEREVPRRIVGALLSGIGVTAEVECLEADAAGGQQAVHAVVRVGFAPGTTHEQRRRAVRLLDTLAPSAEAYGEYLDLQQGRRQVSLAEVAERGRDLDH